MCTWVILGFQIAMILSHKIKKNPYLGAIIKDDVSIERLLKGSLLFFR